MNIELKHSIIDANTGADAIQRAPIVDYNTGKKCLRIGDISNHRKYNEWGYTEVTEENYKKYKLEKEDILIARTGSTIGSNLFIEQDYQSVYNNGLIRLKIDKSKYNSKFIYYVMQSNKFKNYINGIAFGTTGQPNMKINDLLRFKFNHVSLEIQNKIVKILDALDKKIELNNQMNDNLLEIINTQYNDYVRSVSNFDILAIRDIFDFSTGVEPGSKNYLTNKQVDTINFYRVGDMNSIGKTFIKTELAKNEFVSKDDILVSFDATIGRIAYGLEGSYSTGIKKVSINNNYKDILNNSIVFAYFNNNETQETILKYAKGTTILHAGTSIDHLSFKYNENEILRRLPIISSAFEKMKAIKSENQILEQLRDILLPKLMSGEINLEKIVIE